MHPRRVLRALLTPLAGAAMAVACFGGCHPSAPPSDGRGSVCKIDVGSPEAVRRARFGLDPKREHTVKADLEAVASVHVLVGVLEAELLAACEGIARDLGATDESLRHEEGPGKRVERACGVARELLGKAKAEVKGSLTMEFAPPVCGVSLTELARCVDACDPRPDQATRAPTCVGGETSGQCPGACNGDCSAPGGGICTSHCNGRCRGTCSEGFEGVCPGALEGTCDGICLGACEGVMTDGKCVGTCRGTCKGRARGVCGGMGEGTCRGACVGTCEGACASHGALCEGTCRGSCSSPLVEPRCSGWVEVAGADRTCQTSCQALGIAKGTCTPAKARFVVEGDQVYPFLAVTERHFPRVLKVTLGMKAKTTSVSDEAKVAVAHLLGMAKSDAALRDATAACLKAAEKLRQDDAVTLARSTGVFASGRSRD